MSRAVLLAVAASFCTATSSVCQRIGAAHAEDNKGFSPRLILYLLRQPIWLAGVASMIFGFGFQITALHYGSLALVQPILASELLFVFGYMAVIGAQRVRRDDWLASGAMAIGLGVFLFTANPSGGKLNAPTTNWFFAGIASLGLATLTAVSAFVPLGRGAPPSRARKAAMLGIATGVSWGFVAAIIKELSSHTSNGISGVFSTWSLYALIVVGAASMLLSTHALAAGPLAASQPGFTIVDPLVASLLGVFLFSEHLALGAGDVVIEALALAILLSGVFVLSHSRLIHGPADSSDIAPAVVNRSPGGSGGVGEQPAPTGAR